MESCVTGANGFIGAHLVRRLCQRGDRVRALCRAGADTRLIDDLLRSGAAVRVTADITCPEELDPALVGVRRLFHVAGEVSYWGRDRPRLWRVNVRGTRNVLAAALRAGVERVVHTSSVGAVGVPPTQGPPATETFPWNAGSLRLPYFTAKRAAEELAQQACEAGLDVVLVNPAYVVGPGDIRIHDGNIIIDMHRGTVPLCPVGGNCWVDVEDVVEGHLLAEAHGRAGRRYVLGGENLSYREVLGRVAALLGVRPPPLALSPLVSHALAPVYELLASLRGSYPRITRQTAFLLCQCMYFDSTRAQEELGFAGRPFQETLQRTVAWYREQGFLDRPVPRWRSRPPQRA
jgi:dihydroflavonol-4-reductase